jgi:hypothetical protein
MRVRGVLRSDGRSSKQADRKGERLDPQLLFSELTSQPVRLMSPPSRLPWQPVRSTVTNAGTMPPGGGMCTVTGGYYGDGLGGDGDVVLVIMVLGIMVIAMPMVMVIMVAMIMATMVVAGWPAWRPA